MSRPERIPWYLHNNKLSLTQTNSSKTISPTKSKFSNLNNKLPKHVQNCKNLSHKISSSEWLYKRRSKKQNNSSVFKFLNWSKNSNKFSWPNNKWKPSTISTFRNWWKNIRSKWKADKKVFPRLNNFLKKNFPISRPTCHLIRSKKKNNTFKPVSASSDSWKKSMNSITQFKRKKIKNVSFINQTNKWSRLSKTLKKNSNKPRKIWKKPNWKSSRLKKTKTRLSFNLKTTISHFVRESKNFKPKLKTLTDLWLKNKTISPRCKINFTVWKRNLISKQRPLLKRILNFSKPKPKESNFSNKT